MAIAKFLALGIAVLVTPAASDDTSYKANGVCNVDQLMRGFDSDTGLWGSYWWMSASILTAFNNFAALDDDVVNVYGSTWDSVYNNAPSNHPFRKAKLHKRDSGFLNDFYDDEGWWGLAWLGAYDITNKREYLDEAIAIWYDINAAFDSVKCGGVPWKREDSGPLAIPNSLFINLGASLANRVGEDQRSTYIDAALKGWEWFKNAELINSDNLVNDGIGDDCKNDGSAVLTYNSGSIIGALVELYHATKDQSYLDTATDIANASIADGSPFLNDDGLLADGCDKNKDCTGGDGSAFKGVLARYLGKLYSAQPNDTLKAFLEKNAQSIWSNDLEISDGSCRNGLYWSGPYTDVDEYVGQAVALDGLTAALIATS